MIKTVAIGISGLARRLVTRLPLSSLWRKLGVAVLAWYRREATLMLFTLRAARLWMAS